MRCVWFLAVVTLFDWLVKFELRIVLGTRHVAIPSIQTCTDTWEDENCYMFCITLLCERIRQLMGSSRDFHVWLAVVRAGSGERCRPRHH